MKTVLVLSILLCAALAAPAEDKEKAPEMEDNMMMKKEEFVPEESVPVPRNAPVSEEEAPESRYNCPDGWEPHESRCYLFSRNPLTWYKAEEYCLSKGAHLASVTNPRENDLLQQITVNGGQSTAWLGGFNLQGQWMWTDGEGFYYTNWLRQSSSSSFPCAYIQTNGWGKTVCNSPRHFICSKSPFSC